MEVSKILKAVLLVVLLLTEGCASAILRDWPPPSETPTKTIFVSLDTWHAMIGFTRKDLGEDWENVKATEYGLQPSTRAAFEEWGYAEREWYVENQRGVSGMIRAMATESEGIVEIAEHDQLWAKRTPQPPSDLFTFHLSEEGYRNLRNHLRSTIASPTPVATLGASRFYQASQPYSFAHHCHHYVAIALEKAGLPISSYLGLNRTSLATQLEEAEQLAMSHERGRGEK